MSAHRVIEPGDVAREAAKGDPVARVGVVINQHLNDIAALYKPGMRLTLVVRNPAFPDGTQDLVQSNDELHAAIKALELKATEPFVRPPGVR